MTWMCFTPACRLEYIPRSVWIPCLGQRRFNEKEETKWRILKRPNYFTNQFLVERDFKDEQSYQIGMRRKHNLALHSWGIADGGAYRNKIGRPHPHGRSGDGNR